jgi:hypothetical protein
MVERFITKNLAEINCGISHAVFKTRGRRKASVTIPLEYKFRALQKH